MVAILTVEFLFYLLVVFLILSFSYEACQQFSWASKSDGVLELVEAAAEANDELIGGGELKYLGGEELTEEEINLVCVKAYSK